MTKGNPKRLPSFWEVGIGDVSSKKFFFRGMLLRRLLRTLAGKIISP